MDQIELKVTKREVLGKKVRFLRREGITPVHLFGHGIESLALQCDTANLRQVLAEAGQTALVNLKVDGEKRPRTVMVREVQIVSLKSELLHVDFYQVEMAELIKVEVPVILVGEAPALKSREFILTHELNTLSVECLPAKIPASIEVDLSSLTEPDQALRVKDIELDKEVTVLNDPELVLARIRPRPVERVEEPIAVEEEAEAPEAPEEAPVSKEESKEE